MSERSRALFVIAVSVLVAAIAYHFFLRPFIAQQPKVERILNGRSTWSVTLQEYTLHGPISVQTYRVTNVDGKVSMFYSATDSKGIVTKQFSVPIFGPSGTFFFENLRAEGIWELEDKPVRPHPRTEYIVEVQQTLGNEGGSRAFGFSDPDYWAKTNAREFMLRLNPKGKGTDFGAHSLGEAGRPLRDPRYARIVDLFRHFGPQSVLDAENKIRAEFGSGKTRAQRVGPIPA
jgi:hypothetical protein